MLFLCHQKNEQDTESNGCEERPGQATEEDKSGSSCYAQNMVSFVYFWLKDFNYLDLAEPGTSYNVDAGEH